MPCLGTCATDTVRVLRIKLLTENSLDTAEEAARACDRAALEAFGEDAATNEDLGLLSGF